MGEEVCEKVVNQDESRENVSADVSDLSIVKYTSVIVGQSTDVPVDGGKVQRKGKKVKTNVKAKNLSNCVVYPLKHVFGSVGKCVRKRGQYNFMRGGFPLNSDTVMSYSNLVEMMEGLSSFLGEHHVDKEYVFKFNC